MKSWIKPSRVEITSFWIMMPFLNVLLNHLLFGSRLWIDYRIWLISFPIIHLLGFVSWYLHIRVMYFLRERLPHIHQTTIRLILLGISHVLLSAFAFTCLFYSYDAAGFLGYELDGAKHQISLLMSVALTMILTTIWESDYTFKQWKDGLAEKDKLQQLTLQQEFETLKSQVNPHFLFNCFNTLSSLISEDKKQAEVFLNELSKVYRYLLRNNEDGVSTLANEIRFIQSYYRLLQTRHGEAVQLTIEINKKYEQYVLPSLSLQMLVENAVKHNVLSRNKPLLIDIFTTAGNKLVVTNNLQRRTIKGPSNRIGLDNIKTKYELLHQKGFQVLEDGKSFCVVLPLIWNRVLEEKQLIPAEL